jgi:membrane AbrB-like protein
MTASMRNNHATGKNWALLTALTLCCMGALSLLRIPAAPLLGAIVISIAFALRGMNLREPLILFHVGQNIVGCMMAASISPAVLASMLDNWFLMAVSVVFAIVVGFCVGMYMTLRKLLPGTTGIWGASPGAAAAMTVMSEAYGADMRLVAFMQYLRVVLIALSAVVVARAIGVDPQGQVMGGMGGGVEILRQLSDWSGFLPTLALLLASGYLSRRFPFTGGPLLLPLFLGAALQGSGVMRITLPMPLLVTAYALLGWGIGLRFDRQIFFYALHVMPKILAAILVMMGSSACLAVPLVLLAGVDPLTAYLATSPGGMDSMSIIAASSGADLAFVMTIQAGRMILVTLISPPLARFAATHVKARERG